MKIFRGTLVHSLSVDKLQIIKDGIVGIENTSGKILFVEDCQAVSIDNLQTNFNFILKDVVQLKRNSFLIPGFIDTHIHAPQFVFTGTGYDVPLLQWLEKYTFPRESQFKDPEYACFAYQKPVFRTLRCGTTSASYYGTIHLESNKILAKIVHESGQRAFIGKVNMDCNSPDFYVETTANSINETKLFVEFIKNEINSDLIHPVITPRFAPSCTEELFLALVEIATKFNLLLQTHISENRSECEWVKELFPNRGGYAEIYNSFGLLNERSVMAHCIYLTDAERAMFKEKKVGISHCPNSNFSIQSGVLNVRQLLNQGFEKIGLGTDCAGGYSPSILDAMRLSILSSKVVSFDKVEFTPITFKEAIYFATLGGAKVLNIDDKVGNFLVGKEFDGLLIDLDHNPDDGQQGGKSVEIFPHDVVEDFVEKFIYLGDDRNIREIYVKGKKVFPRE